MQTNRKLSEKNSSKWETTWKMKRSRPGDWHIHGTAVRNAKSYNLSAVLSSWRLLRCYAYADGPQFTVSSPLLKNITNAYPVGSFAQYLWEVLSVVSSHVTCGFCETSKNKKPYGKWKNAKAENGSMFGQGKGKTPNLKCSRRKLTRILWAWTLKWRFLKGPCRSLIPQLYLISLF